MSDSVVFLLMICQTLVGNAILLVLIVIDGPGVFASFGLLNLVNFLSVEVIMRRIVDLLCDKLIIEQLLWSNVLVMCLLAHVSFVELNVHAPH